MDIGWSIVTAVAVLTCSACNSGKRRETSAPPPKDAAVEVRPPLTVHRFDTPPVKLPSQKSFAVIASGKGPAESLRYELTPGDSAVAIETRLTSKRLTGGTWSEKQALPLMRTGLVVTAAGANGPLTARVTAGEVVGKPTPEATQYVESWNAFAGRTIEMPLDARGQLGELTFVPDPARPGPAGDAEELTQRLLAMTVPVPEEPIAVGGKWRVVTVLRQRPAVVKQTATYTLIARTAKTWKIGVEILRVAEQQIVLEPGIPDGTVVELMAMVRRFEGTLHVDPKQPLPVGKLKVSSSLHIRFKQLSGATGEEIVEDSGTVSLVHSPLKPGTGTAPAPRE